MNTYLHWVDDVWIAMYLKYSFYGLQNIVKLVCGAPACNRSELPGFANLYDDNILLENGDFPYVLRG